MIRNRQDGAKRLTERLRKYQGEDGIVLAIPRGGVPIGAYIAKELGFPVEVILSKKIGHPRNPEFAIGAVSMDSVEVNESLAVPREYIEKETQKIQEELKRRYQLFMASHKPTDLHNKLVILVDDGIATGHTLMSTILMVKKQKPKKLVVAVPVAPPSAIKEFEPLVDELICLLAPPGFYAVGQFYEEFQQVSDEEVISALKGNIVF
ncbi:phosphoribosyltransferase [Adhaeribacter sp. BT258]|uniref:Phosphoribosyltransferase n=1 Tax=Adhaeribacter terrigena TaxID=2793070 RepID=A0ABS1BX83_9BACT|nr:phosphoribosyltransferase family protein [Adhaeribacter terrigena]MBK0401679.1 phosphoribosyltransferase [Adhaeribacter terrigena]